MNENINDFIVGNNTKADAIGNETLEPQTSCLINFFGRSTVGTNSASQDQTIEKNIADKIRKEVGNAVMAFENRVHDAILTAMDNVVIAMVEMAVTSISESSGRRHRSMVQNPDQRDYSWSTENTPLLSACSRVDLNIYEKLVTLKTLKMATLRHRDLTMTKKRTLITMALKSLSSANRYKNPTFQISQAWKEGDFLLVCFLLGCTSALSMH